MIMGFNDAPYFFLNNKYSCNVFILDRRFGNAEAAYQAHKTMEVQIVNIFTTLDAYSAQSIGREVHAYDGWENDKIRAMLLVVFEKFRQNPDILQKLLDTENQKLVAVSITKESFWGTLNGEGKNILGKILMYIREYFKNHNEEREKLYNELEDIHSILKAVKTPIKKYGILYNNDDIEKSNNNFNDCISKLESLKLKVNDYTQFFLVDENILTEATKQFTK